MGVADALTAKYFCDLIGVSTVETTSIRKSNSIEGELNEYGQKNISTLKRNLLNVDEILRIPSTKLLVVIRGNKPLLLDKIIYKKHTLASKLKDSSVLEYSPKWSKKSMATKISEEEEPEKEVKEKKKLSWDTF